MCGYLSFKKLACAVAAGGKVIEEQATQVIEVQRLSRVPSLDLDVTLATADLEKEKAPVWGLRGFLPGLEVAEGCFGGCVAQGWGSKGT